MKCLPFGTEAAEIFNKLSRVPRLCREMLASECCKQLFLYETSIYHAAALLLTSDGSRSGDLICILCICLLLRGAFFTNFFLHSGENISSFGVRDKKFMLSFQFRSPKVFVSHFASETRQNATRKGIK